MPSENKADLFASTANYYSKYRPGYTDRPFEYLAGRFGLDDTGRVLDLGCGTGEISIPISAYVNEVLAMDPNESMLDEGRKKANNSSRSNIEWRIGSDRDVSDRLGTFQLVTMGRSFHWMDQKQTLESLLKIIRPGGGVAIFGNREWFTRGTKNWQREVYSVTTDYLSNLPDRTGPVEYDDPWHKKIAKFGFRDVEELSIYLNREWTVDEIVGYLFSLSYCSPEKVGDQREELEKSVRNRLANLDQDSFVQEDIVTIISGCRPTDN